MVAIILGLAILPAIFSWTMLLAVKPGALKIFRPLICRKDEKMEVCVRAGELSSARRKVHRNLLL
ncbi:MAG TPA: hypothetical protein VIL74_17085 [Pyrinomonadaceae bacterium]